MLLLVLVLASVPLLIANQIGQFASSVSNALFVILPYTLVFVAIKRFKNERNNKGSIVLFLIFSTLAAIAETIWIVYETVLKVEPFPSPADFFWLLSYATLFSFLLLDTKTRYRRFSKQTATISALLSAGFLIPILLTAYHQNHDSELLSLAISLAYPVTDVPLLFFAIANLISIKTNGNDKFLLFMIGGIASFVVSDTLYIGAYENYENGSLIDIGWVFGYCFLIFSILNFKPSSIISKQTSKPIRYEMISKFVVPFGIFVGFAIIISYAINLHSSIESVENKRLIEEIMYITFVIMSILATVAFLINKNTSNLVGQITRDLNDEQKALQAKSSENELLLEKLEQQNVKLKEMDRLKDEFTSMITHELKTPLTPILSWSAVLKSQKDFGSDPIRLKAIQKIESNTLKLSQLISDILDAEKLELKKMPFHKKEFEVEELVSDIYENYKHIMERDDITFNVVCDQKIMLFSDIDRIEQVLKNFLNNSMDFVPKPGGKIELKIEKQESNITFSVTDNGVGISEENQLGLFKKFYQIDSSMTRRHGGSGLGLSICKEIVENLGGAIGVKSELGKGSTFYFYIPIKQ